jgi:glycosyltransferase 2 family protein
MNSALNSRVLEPTLPLGWRSATWQRRNVVVFGLKLLVSGGIVFYLLRSKRVSIADLRFDARFLLVGFVALGVLLALPLLLTVRWRILLRSLGHEIDFQKLARLTYMVVFFDAVLPGGASDVVRGWYLSKDVPGSQRVRAFSTVFLDRLLGLVGFVLCAAVAVGFGGHPALAGSSLQSLRRAIGALILGLLFATFLFLGIARYEFGRPVIEKISVRFPKLAELGNVYDLLRAYSASGGALARALAVSVGGNCLTIIAIFLMGRAIGESHLGFADYCCVAPLGLLVSQIPVTLGGIGVGHAGFYSLFQVAGSKLGAEIFSLFLTVRFISGMPGLLFFLLARKSDPARSTAGANRLVPGLTKADGRQDGATSNTISAEAGCAEKTVVQ